MNKGDIVLINFPFTIPSLSKVRPSVVLIETDDKFRDIVVCAISSVLPPNPSNREIILRVNDSDFHQTGL
ncbi:MAG: type II toxin-antitoxin system PemK/MazF family toxin [Ignavibacteriae bacterium]|nr:type II toxin-antitoxin system PemK/MazF family toxin [Ignavibacteriota bacterium]